jgi:hypothetical protein
MRLEVLPISGNKCEIGSIERIFSGNIHLANPPESYQCYTLIVLLSIFYIEPRGKAAQLRFMTNEDISYIYIYKFWTPQKPSSRH